MLSLLLATSGAPATAAADCRVLSLSGGGSFGAFEAGVLARMLDDAPGLDYDFHLGVSAGALNAGYLATYAQGPAGFADGVASLKELWETTKSSDVRAPLQPSA